MMRTLGLKAQVPYGPATSRKNDNARIYPYLLKKIDITQPHKAWQIDITYIRMQ